MVSQQSVWKIAVILALVVCAFLYFFKLGGNVFTYKTETGADAANYLPNQFWTALAAITALSVLVERSVEIILKASGWHPPPVQNPDNPSQFVKLDITPTAALLGLIIGVIVSASGVRIMDSLISYNICPLTSEQTSKGIQSCTNKWGAFFFSFSDIILTAGLLAGGAHTLHPYLNALADFGVRLKNAASGTQTPVVTDQAESILVNTELYKKLTAPEPNPKPANSQAQPAASALAADQEAAKQEAAKQAAVKVDPPKA